VLAFYARLVSYEKANACVCRCLIELAELGDSLRSCLVAASLNGGGRPGSERQDIPLRNVREKMPRQATLACYKGARIALVGGWHAYIVCNLDLPTAWSHQLYIFRQNTYYRI
jgi:hypothetical protein